MAGNPNDWPMVLSPGALDDADLADVDLSGLRAEWAIITRDEHGLHVTMRMRSTGAIPSQHASMSWRVPDGGD